MGVAGEKGGEDVPLEGKGPILKYKEGWRPERRGIEEGSLSKEGTVEERSRSWNSSRRRALGNRNEVTLFQRGREEGVQASE